MKKIRLFIVLGILLGILFLFFATFVKIKPSERGVVFQTIINKGINKERTFGPGYHIIAPWNEIIIYDVKVQQREEKMDVLEKNGLSLTMDVTVQFRPIYDRIGYLHEQFPKTYIEDLIIPQLRSAVRSVSGKYSAEEIYSTKRQVLENEIIKQTETILNEKNVHLEALLIRSIKLPAKLKEAIETKQKEEQEALAYEYKLEKERKEAERKKIAAEGEAEYNRVVNNSLTPNLLRWKGIEATLKLAESENTKVVVIGGSENGLPIILNDK